MIGLLIWFLVVLIVAGAVLSVVRAALATPLLAWVAPYAGLIYALVVLLIVLLVVQAFYGSPLSLMPLRSR